MWLNRNAKHYLRNFYHEPYPCALVYMSRPLLTLQPNRIFF